MVRLDGGWGWGCGSKCISPAVETIGNLVGIGRRDQGLQEDSDKCLNLPAHTPNIIPLDDMQILTEGLVDERLDMNDGEFRPWNHRSCHGLFKRHEDLGEGFLDDLWFRSRKMSLATALRIVEPC